MKKASILVGMALVAMLSTVASAGVLNTDFGGAIGYEIRYDQHDGLVSRGMFDTRMTVTGQTGTVRVDFDVAANYTPGNNANFADRRNWIPFTQHNLFQGNSGDVALKVQRANVTLNGALWKDGPSVKTSVGRFNFNWDPIVASNNAVASAGAGQGGSPLSHATGVILEGIQAGPATVDLAHFYLNWTASGNTYTDRPTLVRVKGKVDVVDLTGIVVNHEDAAFPGDKSQRVTDYLVSAGLTPASGVKVNATFAADGQTNESHYKVDGELSTIPNLKLTGSVWSTGENFQPRYAHRNPADEWGSNNRTIRKDEAAAFKIGAETTQAGVTLSASYAQAGKHSAANFKKSRTELSAKTTVSDFNVSASYKLDTATGAADTTETKLGVSKALGNVNVAYEGVLKTGEEMKNSISADTTVNTPLADGVKISGKVTLQNNAADGVDTKFEADAEWKAPIGISLGLHYANYARAEQLNKGNTDTLRHAGVPVTQIGPVGGEDGFYVTASYTATF